MAHPQDQHGIVTPEAVLLEFENAGIGSRVLGKALDLAIIGAVYAVIAYVFGLATLGTLSLLPVILVFGGSAFLLVFGYPFLFEAFWRGRTLGKAALGLRVVTVEGAPAGTIHAAIRSLLQIVDFIITAGLGALLSAFFSQDNRRIGDLAAGTMVLRERAADVTVYAVAFHPPYGYEAYVQGLDVSRLAADQYGTIRTFLLRVATLAPDARFHLAQRLATPVSRIINHQIPNGVPAELFLVCVASAYQQRHGGPQFQPATGGFGPRAGPL
ncbi:MAG: hypothetical protein JJLCMIEE_02392 [Acidimicrobiales bacterium]|nr:hypothetical protein [Acidimicrobiales bacterium]